MNWRTLKEFLKPTRRKIVLPLLLTFYLYITGVLYASFPSYHRFDLFLNIIESVFLIPTTGGLMLLIIFMILYFISCLVVKLFGTSRPFYYLYLLLSGLLILSFGIFILFMTHQLISYLRYPKEASVHEAMRYGCNVVGIVSLGMTVYPNITNISIPEFDANKDGKIDSIDTLQAICENYFWCGLNDIECCVEICRDFTGVIG